MKNIPLTDISGIADCLCVGCGTCEAICPQDAITMMLNGEGGIYLPEVDSSKCNSCHLCKESCPGISFDFTENIFSPAIPYDPFLGHYVKYFVGYAADYNVRFSSSSGGLITALLLFGIEKKLFDGALVTKADPENPLLPKPFVAKTSDSILESSTSKYFPVPANRALKEIMNENGRFIAVGLPCHVEGIRKAQKVVPAIQQKVPLLFGIFCGRGQTFHMTNTLLARLKLQPEEIASLKYRGNGWPGKIEVVSRSGKKKTVDYLSYYGALGGGCFHPLRCLTCPDGLSEFADLSFGDAWRIGKGNVSGLSLMIVRSSAGLKFINDALAANVIKLCEVSRDQVLSSTKGMVNSKKKQLAPCLALSRLFNKQAPNFRVDSSVCQSKNPLCSIVAFWRYFNVILPTRFKLFFMRYTPLTLLHLYNRLFAAIFWSL